MNIPASIARAEILSRVRSSLGRAELAVAPPVPETARIHSRVVGTPASELDLLFAEIVELGGHVRRVVGAADLALALAELVEAEQVTRATLWQTSEMAALGVAETLASLGVKVAPPGAGPRQIAACELGVTGVDAALPETGTLLLRTDSERPRMASLVPRVHLALLRSDALRADLSEALSECGGTTCATFITGPSRTSDIELTLTIGVHGPKALYVWVLDYEPGSSHEADVDHRPHDRVSEDVV